VGTAAHHFFPAYTATPGAYALVGMGAVFAGVVRTPMTSVLMIFEMTQDYAVIVPFDDCESGEPVYCVKAAEGAHL